MIPRYTCRNWSSLYFSEGKRIKQWKIRRLVTGKEWPFNEQNVYNLNLVQRIDRTVYNQYHWLRTHALFFTANVDRWTAMDCCCPHYTAVGNRTRPDCRKAVQVFSSVRVISAVCWYVLFLHCKSHLSSFLFLSFSTCHQVQVLYKLNRDRLTTAP